MNHYTSVYMRDYLWPNRLPACEPKPLSLSERFGLTKPEPRAPCGPSLCTAGDPWDAAKFTVVAEPINLCNIEPNMFLKKLKEKYPYIYETLKDAPMNDLASRVKREIMRTTYQVDICHLSDYANAPYADLLRAEKYKGEGPCSPPILLPGDAKRPNQKQRIIRPSPNDAGLGDQKSKKSVPLTPGFSEYQDGISKLGAQIIRDQIHGIPSLREEITWNMRKC
ncbi:uncharacterized protein LOC108733331 [Agrilus planipennis]|uniref:Uncharacterized protein LOC108733331 n=1 Tax=Agrilus planipennis TaxID=224129 RepID=A0A1W4WHJ0_AGRPL|nr:uncharacterized protein LOC108733331 [Agrilus planipennis]